MKKLSTISRIILAVAIALSLSYPISATYDFVQPNVTITVLDSEINSKDIVQDFVKIQSSTASVSDVEII